MISDRISKDIPPQMNIFNMVIPILMHFCSFVSNRSIASSIEPHIIQQNVTLLMTSNYFRQYNAGYTIANVWCYPIKGHITKSDALESVVCVSSSRCHVLVCSLWLWHFLVILTFCMVFVFLIVLLFIDQYQTLGI